MILYFYVKFSSFLGFTETFVISLEILNIMN